MTEPSIGKADIPEKQGKRSGGSGRSAAVKSGKNTRTSAARRKGTPRSATTGRYGNRVKKSVTLQETVVAEIEARTGPRGFSEFLDAAAVRHLALLKAQEIVDDHIARHGEFTAEEMADAEAAWRGE